MDKILGAIVIGLGWLALVCIIGLLMAWPIMVLWEWLMPILFPAAITGGFIAAKITLWQAWGLNVLCGSLFKSSSSSSSK